MTHPLFRDAGIFVGDVHCHSGKSAFGAAEAAGVFSLVLPRSGVFVARVRGVEVVADPNHALLLKPHEPYRVRHPLNGGDRCSVFCLDTALLRDAFPEPDLPGPTVTTSSWVDREHRSLVASLDRGLAGGLQVEEAILTITGRVIEAGRGRPNSARTVRTRRRQRLLVENAKEILAARFGERLRLGELAGELNCSMYHLSRLFRAHTGVPLHRYQNRLRVRAAMERLALGEDDLSALAADLGYADHSHFTHSFRREAGSPPSAVRRRYLSA